MGLYGAIIVLPSDGSQRPAPADSHCRESGRGEAHWGESDFRLAPCRLRPPQDLLRPRIPVPVLRDGSRTFTRRRWRRCSAKAACTAGTAGMQPRGPDRALPSGVLHDQRAFDAGRHGSQLRAEYPHQPYNGNPHMHPGELVLLRIIGQGRWQHPFHEHANHVRILARDGNLILSATDPATSLAGPAAVHHHTTPGLAWTESSTAPAGA